MTIRCNERFLAARRTGRAARAAAAVLALVALALLFAGPAPLSAQTKLEDFEVGNYPLGGEFNLLNQDGERTRLQDLRGKVVLLAFGYTHCPDVCPTTLSLFKQVVTALGPDAKGLQAVFVSVDPKRDTPEILKRYVGYFDPGFLGLTGTEEELEQLSERYMAKYRTRETASAGGYAVDHTTLIYLLDRQGKVRYLFTRDADRDVIVKGARVLMTGRS